MRSSLLLVLLAIASAPAGADEPVPVEVKAAFVPASADEQAAIRIVITPTHEDVRVKGCPSPRLRLALSQTSLTLLETPRKTASEPPFERDYVEPDHPFRFPVRLSETAPKGAHRIEATVSFVYCSTSKGWCRKGARGVEIPVATR